MRILGSILHHLIRFHLLGENYLYRREVSNY